MKNLLSIDPGQSGGMAWRIGGPVIDCEPMGDTESDVVQTIRALTAQPGERVAYLEKVGGFVRTPKEGERANRQPGSAMFKFGMGYGVIRGALLAFGWRIIEVQPHTWQKHFALGTASQCASKTEWKNKLKAEAQRRYPAMHVTLATADAMLILDYAIAQEG
jgi:hypothetical protein